MNITTLMNELLPPETEDLLRALGNLAKKNGFEIYLVGGIVRDLLLGRANLDIDIAVDGDGQAFALIVAEQMNGSVVMHGRFGTSVVILPGKTRVDIATGRTETYSRPGALPEVQFANIRYDLQRRDFSVNAMAASLNGTDFGELADYFDGLADLRSGVIRSLYPESFIDDPTRILRAVRFETALGFSLDPETKDRLMSAVDGGYLSKVSGARLRKEIFAIAEGPGAAEACERMGDLGIWASLVPGLKPEASIYRTISSLGEAEAALKTAFKHGYRRKFAVLTALLMGSGPDAVSRFCGIIDISRFRASRMADFAARSGQVSAEISKELAPSALYALLENMPEEQLAALWASGNKRVREAVLEYTRMSNVKPLVSGRDLIRWGYPPSKAYAAVLGAVYAKQLDGAIRTRQEAKAEAEKGIIEYNNTA